MKLTVVIAFLLLPGLVTADRTPTRRWGKGQVAVRRELVGEEREEQVVASPQIATYRAQAFAAVRM